MSKPSTETLAVLRGISTEIGAGKSFSSDPDAIMWNNAHDRCLQIVDNYFQGFGLFQMTADQKKRRNAVQSTESSEQPKDSTQGGQS